MNNFKIIRNLSIGIMMAILLFQASQAWATNPAAGEEALFTSSTAPDALLLLDLSGSMDWNPNGDDLIYGSTSSCPADTANCTGSGCSGGFCGSAKSGTTYYANSSCSTPDTTNCVGSGCSSGYCSSSHSTSTYYTASACGTADTINCSGSGCGRSDGFCNSSVGARTYYAHSSCNTANTYHCASTKWSDCSGGFCNSPHSSSSRSCTVACTTTGCSTPCTTGSSCNVSCTSGGCNTFCSRLAIAKRAIFNILDDNNDNTINSSDEGSLGVRMGYMRYYNCSSDDTGNDYSSGCNSLIRAIDSKYSLIYCGSSSSCSASDGSSTSSCVNGENANGGTPLASAVNEAKLYLDAHKANDASKNCRQKFIIFITDGSDTYACSGDGSECDPYRFKNRRESVAKAKAVADAGYKLFVIGFGATMPPYLQNTLNWMAYYGNTDNPDVANSGNTSAYSIPSGSLYPAGVSSCMSELLPMTAACYDSDMPYPTTSGWSQSSFRAILNDPGYLDLSGYAFLASNADQLAAAVKTAINIVRQANYSFSQSSVQSSRTADENFLYEGSFEPITGDSFWKGHLKKYTINDDGTVGGVSTTWTADGDAGVVLQSTSAATRKIVTYKGGSLIQFSTPAFTTPAFSWALTPDSGNTATYVTASDVGVTTDADRNAVVGFIRGDTTYNAENWKLGDVFRSTPITVGTPSTFFEDTRDTSSHSVNCIEGTNCATTTARTVNAFGYHRCTHCRASANDTRLIVAGANGGQFHAFKTSGGSEAWSLVPPNLLTKLKNMTHSTHPTSLTHQYFVDGPVTVADVWSGTDATSCSEHGTCKTSDSWRTILVFGLGRGAVEYSWSSSSSCASGINSTYSTTYPYYCGYYALNLNDSLSPAFLWVGPKFTDTTAQAAQAPYLGDPWSKMMTGRVRVKENGEEKEKWVGFIGAGYNGTDCSGGGSCDTRGKGFVVVDLANGNILWSFTLGSTTSSTTSMNTDTNMKYSVPGQAAIVDTDNDGFIDTAYVGDIGGNMWRFKFCRYADMPNCAISGSTTNWSGGLFYASSSGNIRPIYTSPAVAKDTSGNLWVYWGTGDKTDPTASNAQERFFGVKDDRTSSYGFSDLDNITSATQTYNPSTSTKKGYAINLAGGGEKILADPTVFGGVVYFTAYTPANSSDPCDQSGSAYLYAINYTTGGGALSGGARTKYLGTGIPSAPVMSLKPGGSVTPDLYVTTSGGGGSSASTQRVDITPAGVSNRTNMLYWRDQRIQ